MLGIDGRAARAAWTVFLVVLAIAVVYLVRRTVLIFTLALLLAYLLAPLVSFVDRVAPKRLPRALTLALIYAALIAAAVSIGGAVGHQLETGAREAVPILGKVGGQILSVLGNVGFAILVPILSFFFLKDGASARSRLLDHFAEGPHRAFLDDVLSDVHALLGQFMRALVVLALATLVFYGLFFWIIGLPYAALLAGLASALEFIPVLGPLTASVVIVLVAILSGHVSLTLWIVAFLAGYRLFQDYVLQPFLMSAGVELHPLWILSIPVLATLRVILVRIQKARDRSRLAAASY